MIHMDWEKWVLIGLFVLAALASITLIGKPRKPSTPESAMLGLIFNAGLVTLVLFA